MRQEQSALPGIYDFTQPVEVRGRDLSAVIAEAKAQGFHAHRMSVLPDVVYSLQFFQWNQNATATQPDGVNVASATTSKESLKPPHPARNLCIPASLYDPEKIKNTR